MADDQQQPPDEPRDAAGGSPDRAEADQTRTTPAASPGDETEVRPARDETEVMPAGDDTEVMPAGDETRVMPAESAGDDTEVMPAAGPPRPGDTAVFPSASSWSGRAGVPPPSAVVVRDDITAEEDFPAERRWWMPVLIGLLALALLALLGTGLWLILRAQDDSAPVTPAVTPGGSATPTPTPPSPSRPGTPSAAPTTGSPSVPAQVVVPRLVGLDSATAQSILDTLGLRYRITARPDPSARPGTVLETDPPEGSVVREGTPITVVVAAAAPSPSPPSPVLPSPALPSPTPSR
jgi:hypothetical protein